MSTSVVSTALATGLHVRRPDLPPSRPEPDYQGNGIGTRLIRTLADKTAQNSQDLVLDVLTVYRRAQALYQRLGMREVARHGEGNIKITKRLRPGRLRRATLTLIPSHCQRPSSLLTA